MDPVDLLDLAADLGCISAEEQSFTFRPDSNDKIGNIKQHNYQQQTNSNQMTFSDQEYEVDSNYDGNIVCRKLHQKKHIK